ncbi:MAG TPA: thiosulfate oxidation carrier complex protein SoxZ [Alphaproteobacteria bacterium]
MALKNHLRRIKVPETARRGEIIAVKTMAEHVMEPGVRMDPATLVVYPRFILNRVECHYNGQLVFWADWFSGVSANPYLTFALRATDSGTITVTWTDDYLGVTSASAEITVLDPPIGEVGGGGREVSDAER